MIPTHERGGIIQGFAIAIAIICFAFFVGCLAVAHNDNGHSLGKVTFISSNHGGDNGDDNDQRRCSDSGDNCRGSFSPGPFDRSPVDIHDNQVCISPDCSHKDNPPKSGQQKTGTACLVPVPYHCDPHPEGFIPPNPGKIPQQIADFVKLTFDFVQAVIKFAV